MIFNQVGEIRGENNIMGKGHARNEDIYLNKGGVNEVSAADIKVAVDEKILTEQYTKVEMIDDEEWTITHSNDASFRRVIQVHRDLVNIDTSLDFDNVDESKFVQEDDTKTRFYNDALQLDSDVDSFTKGLFHLNGTEGSTTFTDSSFYAHSTSHNGTVSLTQLEKKFGTASASFAGVDDNYVRTESHADYSINATPFTVDCQLYALDLSHAVTVSIFGATADGFWMLAYYLAEQKFVFWASNNPNQGWNIYNAVRSDVQVFSLNTWHHIALSWDGSNYRLFFDGNKIWDGANPAGITGNLTGFQFGGLGYAAQGPWKGYMDEVRFSKGIARWTANFTPPTEQYKNYDDTKFWYVHTSDLNQIDSSLWKQINEIRITQTTPVNTDLRYLLSVDDRVTWHRWNGAAWVATLLSNISTGNTKAELEALTYTEFDDLFVSGTLDVAVGLDTTDDEVTPILDQINVEYAFVGALLCKDSEFDINIMNVTQTKLTNISGITLTNIRTQIAI